MGLLGQAAKRQGERALRSTTWTPVCVFPSVPPPGEKSSNPLHHPRSSLPHPEW